MKRFVLVLTVFILSATIILSCSDAKEEKRKMEVKSELEGSISDITFAVRKLKNDLESSGEETRSRLNARIDRLEEARDDLKDKLDKVDGTSADQWDAFQESVTRALDNARHTLEEQ